MNAKKSRVSAALLRYVFEARLAQWCQKGAPRRPATRSIARAAMCDVRPSVAPCTPRTNSLLGDRPPDVVEFVPDFGPFRHRDVEVVVLEVDDDLVDLAAVDVGPAVFVREDTIVEFEQPGPGEFLDPTVTRRDRDIKHVAELLRGVRLVGGA